MSTSEMSLLTTTSQKEPSRPTGTQVGGRGSSTPSNSPQSVVLAKGANVEELLASLPYSLMRLVNVDSDHWTKPESMTAGEVQSSRGWLPRAEALLIPADKKLVEKWLKTLGILCAGQMTAVDAQAKISAYVPLLDCPASILNKRTLADAGRAFKWFPSFSEVSAFLNAEAFVMRKLAARLRMLAETTPQIEHQPGSDYKELTQEQKDEIDRKIGEAKRAIDEASRTLKGVAITPA
jgi:hypothetical protein